MREIRSHIQDRLPLWQPGDVIDIAAIDAEYRAEGYTPASVVVLPDGTIVVTIDDTPVRQPSSLGPIERAAWLADNADFRRRVRMVLFKVAVEVQREADTLVDHPARSALAYDVLRDPDRFAVLFAATLSATLDAMRNVAFTDPAAPNQALVTDGAILAGGRDLWSAFAVNGG